MLRKKIVFLLLMISMLCTVSGCWDSKDINDMNFVTATAIDKKGDQYIFLVEVANLAAESEGNRKANKYFLTKAYGKSYIETRVDLDIKMDKKEYLGATQTLILTRDLAKSGIQEYMYRLRNLIEYRRTLEIVTTSDKVEDLFYNVSQKDLSMGETIKSTLETLMKNGQVIHYSSSEILEWLTSDYICFLLPNTNLKDNEIAITGYTVIKKGYYNGYLPIEDSNGLLCFQHNQAKLIYNVPFKKNIAIVEVKLKKRQIKPVFNDNKITFDVSFKFQSQVQYLDVNEGLDESAIKEVTTNLKAMIIKDLNNAVVQSQNTFKGDYLGFYNAFRVSYPNEIKEMNWYKEYLTSKINIMVETSLDPGGTLDYDPPKK